MITKTIISRSSNGSINITYFDDRDDIDQVIDKHITRRGLSVEQVIDGVVEKPSSREDRDCWELVNGKIEVDSIKLSSKASKKTERDAILEKLKITEEEFRALLK